MVPLVTSSGFHQTKQLERKREEKNSVYLSFIVTAPVFVVVFNIQDEWRGGILLLVSYRMEVKSLIVKPGLSHEGSANLFDNTIVSYLLLYHGVSVLRVFNLQRSELVGCSHQQPDR